MERFIPVPCSYSNPAAEGLEVLWKELPGEGVGYWADPQPEHKAQQDQRYHREVG